MGTCQICVPPNSHWTSCFSSLPIKHFLVPSFQVYITNKKQVKPLETKDITTQKKTKIAPISHLGSWKWRQCMATSFSLVEGWLWLHLLCEVDGSVDHSRCYQDKSWPFETVTAQGLTEVFFHKMRSSFHVSHVVWSCIFFAHSSCIIKAFKSTFCCSCSAKLLSLRSMVRCLDNILHHSIYEFY